jgi:hypothetical protein
MPDIETAEELAALEEKAWSRGVNLSGIRDNPMRGVHS